LGSQVDDKGRTPQEQADAAVAEFLARGGVIKQIPMGQRTEPADQKSQWGRPRKKSLIPPEKD
jgi:hypothetical protein